MQTIEGTIENIRFQNPDNGWCAAQLLDKETKKPVSITGVFPALRVGMTIRATGEIEQTKYGPTFRIQSWSEARPSDVEGIEKYLASGLVKNIGPVFARAIVATFGEQTLDIMDNEPERLAEVKGIGKKRIDSIIESAREQKAVRGIMIWLKRYDIPNGLAAKIYQHYKENAVAILEENPYRLADEVGGIGFKKADQVARQLGIPEDSPFRIRSGIHAVLSDAASEGHTCLPVHKLLDKACSPDYLYLVPAFITEAFSDPMLSVVFNDYDEAALPLYEYAEQKIAANLQRLVSGHGHLFDEEPDMQAIQLQTGIEYSDEQTQAVREAVNAGVLIITGGPGTGKTATTNAIIRALEAQKKTVTLAAPTGRAAKRMSEVTGHQASTIHRLLEYTQGSFARNETMPLDGDAFIIDESSMIDTLLMNSLLKAIPDGANLILVGDVDQLPSVGAGCVLRDLIDSGTIPTVRLTHIYRQAEQSQIIVNAHRINKGLKPNLRAVPGEDFMFLHSPDTQSIHDFVVDLVAKQIPAVDGIPSEDIQVLCPMRRDWDPVGATVLNKDLQNALNPDGKVVARVGITEFRTGDKIMQVHNNYEKDIFNGDIGTVIEKLPEGRDDNAVLKTSFNGNKVLLTQKEVGDLELAYACTIHKSQGSEYRAVVIPIHKSQFIMLKRNLLYTGVTRARKLCILVGGVDAVMTAVGQEDTKKRHTNLKEKLKKCQN